jgi:hypothetical protein
MSARKSARPTGTARRIVGLCALAVAAVLATSVVVADAVPGAAPKGGGATPAMTCAAVAGLDLALVPGAPAEIVSATVLAAKDNTLGNWEACQVRGILAPQTQFQLLLPTRTWQGRYLQTGCGGYCGSVAIQAQAATGCVPLTDGAFAVASDNEGHYGGSAFSGIFGADPTLRVAFGYESEHQLAMVAKALVGKYYGAAPAYSYYDGCSQGGHEGLTEAQRYPHDFNGILAGAPASIMTELNVWYQGWNTLANRGVTGGAVLSVADLAPLHRAVLDACDRLDGAVDGLLADPTGCPFDPASIACSGKPGFCLTGAQVEAVRKLYAGPRDTHGRLMYPGWEVPGSELNWANWLVPSVPGAPVIDQQVVEQTLRYLVNPGVEPDRTVDDVRFTAAQFAQLTRNPSGIYDATDPDLSAFRDAGGKLLLWHGWADPAISPVGTIAYYQAVQDAMGGLGRTQQFARLFMLPGVAHCGGGEGPDSFDGLSAVVDWAEHGTAPDKLVTSKLDGSGKPVLTRPVYPYAPTAPSPGKPFDPRVPWLGSFTSGYEQVCGWVNGQWVCRRGKN